MRLLTSIFRIAAGGIKWFSEQGCFTKAAAISFYAFFSLVPILFLITALLGFILGTRTGLLDDVITTARESIPYLSEGIIEDLRGLVENWKALGWLGIFVLVWSADFVLLALENSLHDIFEVRDTRGFFLRKLTGMAVLLVAIIFVLMSLGITTLVEIVKRVDVRIFEIDLGYYLVKSLTFKYFLPFLLVVSAVAFVYKIIAGRGLGLIYAFYGSLVFTTLWELAKHLFAWYITNFASYNKFYGSIGALMILLLWIFYSMIIFLFGASIARVAHMERTGVSPG